MVSSSIRIWTLREIALYRSSLFLEWHDSWNMFSGSRLGFIAIRNGVGRLVGYSRRVSYSSFLSLG